MLQETVTFDVTIVLSTAAGEVPTNEIVREMIESQMSGILDDDSGLECIYVGVEGRSAD